MLKWIVAVVVVMATRGAVDAAADQMATARLFATKATVTKGLNLI